MRIIGVNNIVLQLVVVNGYFEIVQIFRRVGEILDGIVLYYFVVRGYNYVVQYLLREGMKDICIYKIFLFMFFDEENSELNFFKVFLYDNCYFYLCEIVFYVVIRSGYLLVIKMLLSED